LFAILSRGGRERISSFLDLCSIFVGIGGLIASLFISFKKEQIKLTGKVLKDAFHKNDQRRADLIALFIHLSERARREGILALENEVEEIEDPFLKKGDRKSVV